MEKNLNELLNKINETLIIKKNEIRKKLFNNFINFYKNINIEDSDLFYFNTGINNDKEYKNLKNEYEKTKKLIFYNNKIIKNINFLEMEKNLTELNKINETLIIKKNEIKKKLFEKFINFYKNINDDEDYHFFYFISIKIDDKEYKNLIKEYEKIKNKINYINQLEKH